MKPLTTYRPISRNTKKLRYVVAPYEGRMAIFDRDNATVKMVCDRTMTQEQFTAVLAVLNMPYLAREKRWISL